MAAVSWYSYYFVIMSERDDNIVNESSLPNSTYRELVLVVPNG